MPTQYGNLAATRTCIAEYAVSNSSTDLSSYCPGGPGQCSQSAEWAASRGPTVCEVEKAERFAFRLSVFVLPPDYFACGKLRKNVAAGVILGFILGMKTGTPYRSRRTSCVLRIPRILTDARHSQHAWQGLHPVHPTKEGAGPLCWILPPIAAGGCV
jgi:hypothetical protein